MCTCINYGWFLNFFLTCTSNKNNNDIFKDAIYLSNIVFVAEIYSNIFYYILLLYFIIILFIYRLIAKRRFSGRTTMLFRSNRKYETLLHPFTVISPVRTKFFTSSVLMRTALNSATDISLFRSILPRVIQGKNELVFLDKSVPSSVRSSLNNRWDCLI